MKPMICAFILIFATPFCFAQETKQRDAEKKQHAGFEWLKQFEGDWATTHNGTMNSRVVGERWIVNELSVVGVSAIQTIGYDAKKRQFIGTWIDSTSSYIWRYTGSLDSTGKTLMLEAEGPDLSDPTTIRKYRDTYEFKSEDEIAAVSQMQNDKGGWQTFSNSTMTRKVK